MAGLWTHWPPPSPARRDTLRLYHLECSLLCQTGINISVNIASHVCKNQVDQSHAPSSPKGETFAFNRADGRKATFKSCLLRGHIEPTILSIKKTAKIFLDILDFLNNKSTDKNYF